MSIVFPNSVQPSGIGNIFVADDNHGSVPLESSNILKLGVSWEANDQLVVRYPEHARVSKKVAHYKNVSIRYEAIP